MRCQGWVHFVVRDGGMIPLMCCRCWKVFNIRISRIIVIGSSYLTYCLEL